MRQLRRLGSTAHLPLIERVRIALITAAEAVELYGDVALPIFERLERELIELEHRGPAMDRARQIARTHDLSEYQKIAKRCDEQRS